MVNKIKLNEIELLKGQEVGCSDWHLITQERINQFADATNDHQFIHIDPERAKETALGTTIAHGFLTLSLLSSFAYEALPALEGQIFAVNYGFDKIRFMAPVKTGALLRGRFILSDCEIRPSGYITFRYAAIIEIKDCKKPALTADWITIIKIDPIDSVVRKDG